MDLSPPPPWFDLKWTMVVVDERFCIIEDCYSRMAREIDEKVFGNRFSKTVVILEITYNGYHGKIQFNPSVLLIVQVMPIVITH